MPKTIRIKAGKYTVTAALNSSATAKSIARALPISAVASRWGGEIYFSIPVRASLEEGAREVLEAGELGYWPTGNAFCIFFGPTPASQGDEIKAASAVNVIGKATSSCFELWNVPEGAPVTVECI